MTALSACMPACQKKASDTIIEGCELYHVVVGN